MIAFDQTDYKPYFHVFWEPATIRSSARYYKYIK